MNTRQALVVLTVVLGLAVAGCGSAEDKLAETLTEKGVEKAIESGADGDADVEVDGESGEFKIETDDGSVSVGSGEVPESFPEDVPLPEGDYEVLSAMDVTGEGGYTRLMLQIPGGDVEDIRGAIEAGLADSGYESTGTSDQTVGEGRVVTLQFAGDEKLVVVSVSGQSTDDGVSVTYTITAAEDS